MRRQAQTIAVLLVLVVVIGGCATKEPPKREAIVSQALPATTRIPDAWRADRGEDRPVVVDWIKSFNDPTLEALVVEAIAANRDLAQASERVRIAREMVVVVSAPLFPQVGGSFAKSTIRDRDQDSSFDASQALVSVGWELDVWGRLRAQRAAASANAESVALDYFWARQSLASAVAKTWYLAVSARQQIGVAERGVALYSRLLELVETRQSLGKDSQLDVVDTRAQLDIARADLVRLRQEYDQIRRALEVLLGRYPGAEIEAAASFPPMPPAAAAGVPASLLSARPDILAAEQVVFAGFYGKQAAELALLPDFSISLSGGRLGSALLSLLSLNPWLVSAGIGMTIPIYEGGAQVAQIKIADARQAAAIAHYGAVVLGAFNEVENALAGEQFLLERLPLEERSLTNRTRAVEIAKLQYQAGRRDMLWVGNLQASELQTAASVVQLRAAQRVNRVKLYLALGGNYSRHEPLPP